MFAPVDNIPELVQMMAWRRPGKKPLYEFTDAYMHYSAWTSWPTLICKRDHSIRLQYTAPVKMSDTNILHICPHQAFHNITLISKSV